MSPDSIVPGVADGKGGALDTLGAASGSTLTTDFTRNRDLLPALNAEHERMLQIGFWFQWSELERSLTVHQGGPHNPQALNRYAYVLGNPLRYTDPTGMQQCKGGDIDGCQGGAKKSGEDLLKQQGQQRANNAAAAQSHGAAAKAGQGARSGTQQTVARANSPVWKGLSPVRGRPLRKSGSGRDTRYYKWDHTHYDIEVFDH